METTQNTNKITSYVYDSQKLDHMMKAALTDIEKFAKINDYHISKKSQKSLDQLKEYDWLTLFRNSSKRSKKRTNKFILRFRNRNTLFAANTFLHFVHSALLYHYGETEYITAKGVHNWSGKEYTYQKKVVKCIDKIKIEKSLKEQNIQEKRKLWIIARNHSEKLLGDYKEEKGDFYKL